MAQSKDRIKYYAETIQDAASDNGIKITQQQAESMCDFILTAIENESLSCGIPCSWATYGARKDADNWKDKYLSLQVEFENYKIIAERNARKIDDWSFRTV